MRIAVISDYESHGGAAIAATRFATEWSRRDCTTKRFVFRPDSAAASGAFDIGGQFSRCLTFRCARKAAPRHVARLASPHFLNKLSCALHDYAPDIINIHNLHGAWWADAAGELLGLCGRIAPVVWTLHDMWSFTGCCPYSLNCSEFVQGCTTGCQVARSYFPFSAEHVPQEWARKQQALSANPGTVAVSPSRWLAQLARRGLWKSHRVEVIPNGIDTELYKPQNVTKCRAELGLPMDSPVILASYHPIPHYKGASTVSGLVELFRDQPWQWAIIGSEPPTSISSLPNVRSFGHVTSEQTKISLFACADLYVHASLAENLPNTIIECMMCGTPTVAFDVGGVPELVRPGVTGWLATTHTAEALGAALSTALTGAGFPELRASCRSVATSEYSDRSQAANYLRLFQQLAPSEASVCQIP